MILISNLGNTYGKIPEKENHPFYIEEAISSGYDVKVDVWYTDGIFSLGQEAPQYIVSEEYLTNDKFWCQAKNIEVLDMMLKNGNIHCFWHQNDSYTLTSKGLIWTLPGQTLTSSSVCVLPESFEFEKRDDIFGICSDYIFKYK